MRNFQSCYYTAKAGHDRRYGIAKLTNGFGLHDVEYIVDAETGKRVPSPIHDYYLMDGPNSYITIPTGNVRKGK